MLQSSVIGPKADLFSSYKKCPNSLEYSRNCDLFDLTESWISHTSLLNRRTFNKTSLVDFFNLFFTLIILMSSGDYLLNLTICL